jgi:hypothetical protein
MGDYVLEFFNKLLKQILQGAALLPGQEVVQGSTSDKKHFHQYAWHFKHFLSSKKSPPSSPPLTKNSPNSSKRNLCWSNTKPG